MSSEVFDPAVTDEVKDELDIKDSVDDEELGKIEYRGRLIVTAALKSKAATLPLTTGTVEYDLAVECVKLYMIWQWKKKKKQKELAESRAKDFKEAVGSLLQIFDIQRTERTKTVLITADPRDAKTILPTQANILNFDDY